MSYFDEDDWRVREFGQQASPSQARAVAAVVYRYQKATAVADGVKACSLIFSIFAEAVAEDYGRNMGPRYARGKTCSVVLSKIFAHERRRFGGVMHVTGVRVKGNQAIAILGSATRPASYFALKREGGAWKINMPLRLVLP